jgi:hypothetical protein
MANINAKDLYETTLSTENNMLTQKQKENFILACRRVLSDNPANHISDHIYAARIYLKFILGFPDMEISCPSL